jgi:hypothetical protein
VLETNTDDKLENVLDGELLTENVVADVPAPVQNTDTKSPAAKLIEGLGNEAPSATKV